MKTEELKSELDYIFLQSAALSLQLRNNSHLLSADILKTSKSCLQRISQLRDKIIEDGVVSTSEVPGEDAPNKMHS